MRSRLPRNWTRCALVATLALMTLDAGVWAAKAKRRATTAPAASQPAAPDRESPDAAKPGDAATPAAIVGRWTYGSVSPTTYWDADTGVFKGNARGASRILEFDGAGGYKEYTYLELRTAGLTTKAWTVHGGTAAFAGDRVTLKPTGGHYQTWINDKPKTDRDMTADERATMTTTYRWHLGQDDAGRETLTIPFDDGSKFEFRRAAAEKAE